MDFHNIRRAYNIPNSVYYSCKVFFLLTAAWYFSMVPIHSNQIRRLVCNRFINKRSLYFFVTDDHLNRTVVVHLIQKISLILQVVCCLLFFHCSNVVIVVVWVIMAMSRVKTQPHIIEWRRPFAASFL